MKIDMAGQYRTKSNHMAEVAAIKGQFALGWVEKKGKFEPTSWDARDGTVWTGGCDDDLMDHWTEPQPTRPIVRIDKPGFYRTARGRRAEVTSVRQQFAIGWVEDKTDHHPSTWTEHGCVWSGRGGDELVAEWRELVSQTVTFALVERQGGPEVVWFRNIGINSKVLATRTVTITEGDGIKSAKEQPDDRAGT